MIYQHTSELAIVLFSRLITQVLKLITAYINLVLTKNTSYSATRSLEHHLPEVVEEDQKEGQKFTGSGLTH